jgi:hypothetical protein
VVLPIVFGGIAAFFGAMVLAATAATVRRRLGFLFESYRPELHYMRGPGPKWREKHLAASRGQS